MSDIRFYVYQATKIMILSFVFFTIPSISLANIEITNPNSAESLLVDQLYKITWTGGSEKVEISLNQCVDLLGGEIMCYSLFTPIVSEIENVGYYDWKVTPPVPYTELRKYKIRIRNINSTSSEEVISNNAFSISYPPEIKWFNIYAEKTGGCGYYADEVPVEVCKLKEEQNLVMNWWPLHSNKCEASGNWSGKKAFANGPFIESLGMSNLKNGPKTYTLTCSNASGSISKTITYKYEESSYPVSNKQYDKPIEEIISPPIESDIENKIKIKKIEMIATTSPIPLPIKLEPVVKKEKIIPINTPTVNKQEKVEPNQKNLPTRNLTQVTEDSKSAIKIASTSPLITPEKSTRSSTGFITLIKMIFKSIYSVF